MMKNILTVAVLLWPILTGAVDGYICQDTVVTDSVAVSTAVARLKSLNNKLNKSEKMPEFPGGDHALMQFLREHIVYPRTAAQFRVQGKVIVQFVVEKDGTIGETKIVQSVDKELDYEALRVVKMLPKFKPATVDGEPVPVWYTLPVTFKLPPSSLSVEGMDKR